MKVLASSHQLFQLWERLRSTALCESSQLNLRLGKLVEPRYDVLIDLLLRQAEALLLQIERPYLRIDSLRLGRIYVPAGLLLRL
jgi:hypothetical protein